MSTPSRVTRSASRQPERPARANTPVRTASRKKSAPASPAGSAKKTASGKKKSAASHADESPAVRRRSTSRAGSIKKTVSRAAAEPAEVAVSSVSRASGKVRQLADRADRAVEAIEQRVASSSASFSSSSFSTSSNTNNSHSRRNSDANAAATKRLSSGGDNASSSPAPLSTPKPVIALLPPVLLYATLVSIAHIMVVFAFGKTSLQLNMANWLAAASFGLTDVSTVKRVLEFSHVNHVAFFAVVPLYLIAAWLLRSHVRSVLGASIRSTALSANLARVVSAVIFVLTVCGYTSWDRRHSFEGLNALAVLQFAFMLQEFLLNITRFSGARQLYSVLYLALTAWLSVKAYTFVPTVATPTEAPVWLVALWYALTVINTSDNLAALGGALLGLGTSVFGSMFLALQQVVNYGVLPVMGVALYQKHASLFPSASELKQPSFIESSAAAFVMAAGVFLLVVDSYSAGATRFIGTRSKKAHKAHSH